MWNHRVVHSVIDGEEWYDVHEVYYNKDGGICAMTKEAVPPGGNTVKELKRELRWNLKACEQPILEADMDFAKADWEDDVEKFYEKEIK